MFRLMSCLAVGFVGVPHLRAEVVITEAVTGNPRFVEIQNASEDPVDTSGWRVAVNDAGDYFRINDIFSVLWNLPAEMAPGEILYRHDDDDPGNDAEHYWGGAFLWHTQGPGWVLMMDDAGNAVDFVIWGYISETAQTFNVEIDGHPFTIDDVWTGEPALAAGVRDNSLQRHGNFDNDNTADWRWLEPTSIGAKNEGLIIPEPSTLILLTMGAVGLLAYGWRRKVA